MARSSPQRVLLGWVLLSIALNAIGQILFKAGRVAQPDSSFLSLFVRGEIWGGFIMYALSGICWLWVLSRARLSVVYPLLSLSFPVVVGLSAVLFSESIPAIRWIGVGVIVSGVSLLPRT
jgi:drug/metabolite transporter (DMT)-like permease